MNFPVILLGCCRTSTKKKRASGEFKLIPQGTEVVEKVLSYFTMILYMFSIFYSQDAYFFDINGDDCPPETIGNIREWLFIEITTFYLGVVSGIVFAISAKCFRKVPDSVLLGEDINSDLA